MTDTVDSPDTTAYVRYRDDLERPRPDEDQLVKKIADVLHGNNEWAFKKYRHGIRDAHAKSHGILRGELTVYPDLREPYRQGLFATPATYPVIARLSSTSGALRSDQTRGVRGLGIKVLGVDGPRALPDDTATTQDFILVTHREFPFPDAHAYLKRGMPMAWLLARLPDTALILTGKALGAAQTALKRVNRSLPTALELFSEPNTHILGMTFFSSAPLRWGDYVAKVRYTPLSESVKAFAGSVGSRRRGQGGVPRHGGASSSGPTARSTNCRRSCAPIWRRCPSRMPPWRGRRKSRPTWRSPRSRSPSRTPTPAERRRFGDDVLSFNSWRDWRRTGRSARSIDSRSWCTRRRATFGTGSTMSRGWNRPTSPTCPTSLPDSITGHRRRRCHDAIHPAEAAVFRGCHSRSVMRHRHLHSDFMASRWQLLERPTEFDSVRSTLTGGKAAASC